MTPAVDTREAKRQAVLCWTLTPCGPEVPDLAPGTKEYFTQLVAGRREYAPWMADVLRYSESRDKDVLDVGSGQGIDVFEYAMEGARAVGIDLTPRHVELARSHLRAMGLEAAFVEGDAESMPFPDASFDIVSSNGVLHHTPDIAAALAECRRVLRPGGTLTVILYNRNSLHYWVTQFLGHGLLRAELMKQGSMGDVLAANVEAGSRHGARPLVRVYSAAEVRSMLVAAGFQSIRVLKRQFRRGDVPLTSRIPFPQGFLSRIGKVAGWYVIGVGVKPI